MTVTTEKLGTIMDQVQNDLRRLYNKCLTIKSDDDLNYTQKDLRGSKSTLNQINAFNVNPMRESLSYQTSHVKKLEDLATKEFNPYNTGLFDKISEKNCQAPIRVK